MGKNRRKKTGKRSHLKRFSAAMVSTGRGPVPTLGGMSLGDRARAAQSIEIDPVLEAMFPKDFPTTWSYGIGQIGLTLAKGPTANPRRLVLAKLWQGEHHQGLDKFNEIKLVMGRRRKLSLMIGVKECFFIEENHNASGVEIRRSIMYSSKVNAYVASDLNQICWFQPKSFRSDQNST